MQFLVLLKIINGAVLLASLLNVWFTLSATYVGTGTWITKYWEEIFVTVHPCMVFISKSPAMRIYIGNIYISPAYIHQLVGTVCWALVSRCFLLFMVTSRLRSPPPNLHFYVCSVCVTYTAIRKTGSCSKIVVLVSHTAAGEWTGFFVWRGGGGECLT